MNRSTVLLAILTFLLVGLLVSLGMGIYVRSTSIELTVVYKYDIPYKEDKNFTPNEIARTEEILKQRIRIFGGDARVIRGEVKPIGNGRFEVALRLRKGTPQTLKNAFVESLAKSGIIELRLVAHKTDVNTLNESANAKPNRKATSERQSKSKNSMTEETLNGDEFETLFLTEEYYDIDNPYGTTKKQIPFLVKKEPELVIRTLKSVDYRTEGLLRRPVISLQFNKDDSIAFEWLSKKNINRQLAIVIDGEIKTAPTIKAAITGGRVEIRGIRNTRAAKILAEMLRAGSLPYPLKVAEIHEAKRG